MSKRYKGAVISATPPTTSTSSASGVWTEQQFMQGVASGSWPALAGAPTIGTATAGALSASVTFTTPTYTGSGITGYTVTSSPGGITGTGASSPVTVSGLTAGTSYTFTVTATTAAGQGPASAASNSVTPTDPNYIEDVFSTYLYTGNGSTQTITNGIDLAGKGGLVWIKGRSGATNHLLTDTARGATKRLSTNLADANQSTDSNGLTSFSGTGFSIGSDASYNTNSATYVSWAFREQSKFFDVVTYTGNGSARTIAHNLGSVPGMIVVKEYVSSVGSTDWCTYHRSLGATQRIFLNTTGAAGTSSTFWNNTEPTSTVFSLGTDGDVNRNGSTYVAYLFAHNAGGFGLTGTDNVISCGSFTTDGSGAYSVTLGYEPQLVLMKRTDSTGDWLVMDNMRGMPVGGNDAILRPNTSGAETQTFDCANPTATGFYESTGSLGLNRTFIYIAIRRGPMKVPTDATKVFEPAAYTGNGSNPRTIGSLNTTDLAININRSGAGDVPVWIDRLRGGEVYLYSSGTAAEAGGFTGWKLEQTGQIINGIRNTASTTYIDWLFRRAPNFFDEVCWTGTGSGSQAITHNLNAVPEFTITKRRSGNSNWSCFPVMFGVNTGIYIDSTAALQTNAALHPTLPTSTTYYTSDASWGDENIGGTFVTYLFATCPGVSKVGTYTGTGATQTISCGFTGGARFVLVKRTDSTGDWYVWDTARGMVSGTDPSLLLNSTAAEVNANSIYTTTGGFQIVSTAAGINASGGSYIFLAVA